MKMFYNVERIIYFLLEKLSLEFGQHLAVYIYNSHLRCISHSRKLEDIYTI